jgi:O-antigen/teichoic acid export membrane protein
MNRLFAQSAKHTLDGTILVFLSEALLVPTGIVVAAFLTRRLSPSEYGLYTLTAMSVIWVEWTIVSIFARNTIKLVGEANDWRPIASTSVRMHLLAGCCATILLCLLAAPIAGLLNEPSIARYLRLLSLDVPLFCLAVAHKNILTGKGDFRQRASLGAVRSIARMLLILFFVSMGFSISGALLGIIGASLVELAVSRIFIRPAILSRSALMARQLFDYALPILLFSLSMRVYDKLDLFALKILGGTAAQAGIYGAAQNLSIVPGLFSLAFAPLLLSTITRLLRDGHVAQAKEMGREAMRLVILLLPFAGLMAGAAGEIVALIFGARFAGSAQLLSILIFGALAIVMISVSTAILYAADRPILAFALAGPMLLLAIVGHLILIPRLGPIGAALVNALFANLCAVAAIIAVYRVWNISPPMLSLVRSLFICGLAYAVAALWHSAGLFLLIKLSTIALLIFPAFFLLGEFGHSEIALVRSLISRQETTERSI